MILTSGISLSDQLTLSHIQHDTYLFTVPAPHYSLEVKSLSRARLFATPWTVACTKLLRPWDFLGKSTGVGCCFLLQGIFPTQGSKPGLPHCRQTIYRLSHQGSPTSLLTQYQLQSQSLNHSPEWHSTLFSHPSFSKSLGKASALIKSYSTCSTQLTGLTLNYGH